MNNDARPSILIVDDSRDNIRILVDVLKSDYSIGVATNGADAIAYVEKKLPEIILLDIIMPGMDGYEVCRNLKSNHRTQRIPIIFITALNEISDKAKGFELGAVDYITKPFEVVEVAARVHMHVELKRVRESLENRNQQLNQLSTKLSKYLPHQICASIFSGQRDVTLETRRKKLTIFFSDIVEFTKLTDSMESEPLSLLLNDYLNEMAIITRNNGGTLNKFIGDAILIFFGDPETNGDKEDALACIRMALEMKARMEILRKKWSNQGIQNPPHIRMGINTGFCNVGNFGSEDRLEYTIIGGQVNLTDRLQSHAETDGIWISHKTYSLVKDEIICGKNDLIKVKGIAYPVKAFQLLGLKDEKDIEEHSLLNKAEDVLTSINPERWNPENREQLQALLRETLARISSLSGIS